MKNNGTRAVLLPMLLAGLSLVGRAYAGSPSPPPKVVVEAAEPESSDWKTMLSVPMWAIGIEGNIGVGGFDPVSVDFPTEEVFEHLEMAAALDLEIRYKRWGLMLSGLYLRVGGDAGSPGEVFSSIDVELESVLAEAALFYRPIDTEQGFLDVFAGARYVYLQTTLGFHIDSRGLQEFGDSVVDDVADQVGSAVRGQVDAAVARVQSQIAALDPGARADAIRSAVRSDVIDRAIEDVTREDVFRVLRNATPAKTARIVDSVQDSGRIRSALRQLAEARLQERVSHAAGEVATARARARSAVEKAEARLSDAIQETVRKIVPEEVSGSKSWIDPFVGLRGRLNFSRQVYLAARADVGGFGVGSDLAWNAQIAIGLQVPRSFATELGYRYLSMDYAKDAFLFDASISGFFLGLNLAF